MKNETPKIYPARSNDNRWPGKGRLLLTVLDEQERSTKGGLFIPSTNNDLLRAKITSYGECQSEFEIGDVAYLMKGSGIDIGMSEIVVYENEILYTEEVA